MPRFFVINPINDRRSETRFDAVEPVAVQIIRTRHGFRSEAFEIGHFGMRMESDRALEIGERLQIEFTNRTENIGCWGQVAWCDKKTSSSFNCGVAIESWFGIVDGPDSWKNVKGFKPKRDRRFKLR